MRLPSVAAAPLIVLLNTCLLAQQTSPEPLLRVTSRIVVVDICVTDKKGAPVSGLTSDDFDIRENGAQQQIKSFEEHTIPLQLARTPVSNRQNHFVTPDPQDREPTATVILLDMLNNAQLDQTMMRESISQFLKHQPANAQVAIFGLTNRLMLLQPFTTDPALLKKVIDETAKEGRKEMAKSNRTLADPALGSMADTFGDIANGLTGEDSYRMAQLSMNLNQYEGSVKNQEQKATNLMTFQALTQLATYLGALPGKKNLIWFSAGIPILTIPDQTMQHPSDAFNDSRGDFADLINLMNKGRITVYPIDPRGASVVPSFTAVSGSGDPVQRMRIDGQTTERSTAQIQGAGILAQKTGGQAFFFRNDLDRAVSEVINLGSKYYSVSYTPTNQKWDGKFRKLEIALKQKGYHIAYREGYYASDTAAPQIDETSTARVESVMKGAMLFGAPARGDLPFTVDIDLAAEKEDSPVAKTEFPAEIRGPFKRYRLDYTVDPRSLAFAEHTPGSHEGSVRFLLLLYDFKGNIIASTNNVLIGKLPTKAYERLVNTGLHLHQEISAPQSGTFIARIAVEDLTTGKVGAMEIPLTMRLPAANVAMKQVQN